MTLEFPEFRESRELHADSCLDNFENERDSSFKMLLAKVASFLIYKAPLLLLVIGVTPGSSYSICDMMCYKEEYIPCTFWSECSTYRGIGYQTRTVILKKYFFCGGTTLQWYTDCRLCQANPYGHWSQWSKCSTSCEQGFQKRTRKCIVPGLICNEDETIFRTCSDNPICPDNFSML